MDIVHGSFSVDHSFTQSSTLIFNKFDCGKCCYKSIRKVCVSNRVFPIECKPRPIDEIIKLKNISTNDYGSDKLAARKKIIYKPQWIFQTAIKNQKEILPDERFQKDLWRTDFH